MIVSLQRGATVGCICDDGIHALRTTRQDSCARGHGLRRRCPRVLQARRNQVACQGLQPRSRWRLTRG